MRSYKRKSKIVCASFLSQLFVSKHPLSEIELSTLPQSILEEMNARLVQILSNNSMSDSTKSSEQKKKFEPRLNPIFQKLILTASSLSINESPPEPISTAREFLEEKNASEVKLYLYHKLNLEKSIPIYIPAGVVTVLHSGCIFWDC